MPIKNVSDRRRIPRLGKIRAGIKVEKKDGAGNVISTHPKAVPWFVCPPEVAAVYGAQPTELDIIFPVEDPEIIASQYLKYYSKTRGLVCRGTGESAMALVDVTTGEIAKRDAERTELRAVSCNPNTCQYYATKYCKERLSLQFMLPKVPGLGVYQIDSSYWSIVNVNSCLEVIKATCGRVSGIPLVLALVPQVVQPEGKKKTVSVLQIKINECIGDLIHSKPFAIDGTKPLQLEAPAELEPEEIAEPTDYLEEDAQEPPPPPAPPIQRITAQSMMALMALLGVDSTDGLLVKARERWSGRDLKHVNEITEAEADLWIKQLQQYNVRPVTVTSAVHPTVPAPSPAPDPVTEEDVLAKRRAEMMTFIFSNLGQEAYREIIFPEIAKRWEGKKGVSELNLAELDEIKKFVNYQVTLKETLTHTASAPAPAATPVTPAPAPVSTPAAPAVPAPAASTKKAAKPKSTREAPARAAATTTGNEVKAFIASLIQGGCKDDEIKTILFESTGKKAGWTAEDMVKAKAYVAANNILNPAKAAAKIEQDAYDQKKLFGEEASAPVVTDPSAAAFLREQGL